MNIKILRTFAILMLIAASLAIAITLALVIGLGDNRDIVERQESYVASFEVEPEFPADWWGAVVTYEGDATTVSDEYTGYKYFKNCKQPDASCNLQYYFVKDEELALFLLLFNKSDQEFIIEGSARGLGSWNGIAYFELTEISNINYYIYEE